MAKPTTPIHLDTRLALRIPEAASALGLSEGCFRKIMPEIEKVHAGRVVLIPVQSLKTWLKKSAQAEQEADDQIVRGLLGELG